MSKGSVIQLEEQDDTGDPYLFGNGLRLDLNSNTSATAQHYYLPDGTQSCCMLTLPPQDTEAVYQHSESYVYSRMGSEIEWNIRDIRLNFHMEFRSFNTCYLGLVALNTEYLMHISDLPYRYELFGGKTDKDPGEITNFYEFARPRFKYEQRSARLLGMFELTLPQDNYSFQSNTTGDSTTVINRTVSAKTYTQNEVQDVYVPPGAPAPSEQIVVNQPELATKTVTGTDTTSLSTLFTGGSLTAVRYLTKEIWLKDVNVKFRRKFYDEQINPISQGEGEVILVYLIGYTPASASAQMVLGFQCFFD